MKPGVAGLVTGIKRKIIGDEVFGHANGVNAIEAVARIYQISIDVFLRRARACCPSLISMLELLVFTESRISAKTAPVITAITAIVTIISRMENPCSTIFEIWFGQIVCLGGREAKLGNKTAARVVV